MINKALSRRSRVVVQQRQRNVQKSVMNEQSCCIANTEHIDRNPSRFFAIYLFVRPFTVLMQLNNNHNIFKQAEIIHVSLEQTADMPYRKRLTLNTIYSQFNALNAVNFTFKASFKYSTKQRMETVETNSIYRRIALVFLLQLALLL